MSTNKLSMGKTLTVTAPANKSSGDPVLIGAGIFGIAVDDALSGADMVIETEGMFSMTKGGATAFTAGDTAYYNNSSGLITATTTDLPVGKIYETCAGSGETTCKVILQPVMGTEAEVAALQIAVNDHVTETTDAHDASAISLLDSGTLFTATDVEGAFTELAGTGRTTGMTVKSAYDAAVNRYTVSWTGSNGAGAVALTPCTAGAVPAEGDIIESLHGFVTATGAYLAPLVIGTDVAAALITSTGVKANQLSVANLSANTYYATVRKV